jgi:hypothetical protein
MFSPRRAAQLGLLAACVMLALCVTVLLAFGSAANPSDTTSQHGASSVLGQPSAEHSAQMASFVQAPQNK